MVSIELGNSYYFLLWLFCKVRVCQKVITLLLLRRLENNNYYFLEFASRDSDQPDNTYSLTDSNNFFRRKYLYSTSLACSPPDLAKGSRACPDLLGSGRRLLGQSGMLGSGSVRL